MPNSSCTGTRKLNANLGVIDTYLALAKGPEAKGNWPPLLRGDLVRCWRCRAVYVRKCIGMDTGANRSICCLCAQRIERYEHTRICKVEGGVRSKARVGENNNKSVERYPISESPDSRHGRRCVEVVVLETWILSWRLPNLPDRRSRTYVGFLIFKSATASMLDLCIFSHAPRSCYITCYWTLLTDTALAAWPWSLVVDDWSKLDYRL